MTNEARVYFRDVKPYEVPGSLDELRGPVGGVVELRHSVLWAPGDGRVDFDEPGGVGIAYRAVLSEGTVADQTAVLNRARPTEDVDLFTADSDPAAFGRAVDRVARDVRRAGYTVEMERRASGFARLRVGAPGDSSSLLTWESTGANEIPSISMSARCSAWRMP